MTHRAYTSSARVCGLRGKLPTMSRGTLLALIAGTILRPVSLAPAQTSPAPAPSVSAPAQVAKPEFEVVSIRPSDPELIYRTNTPSLNISGDRYVRFVRISLRDLVMLAYGVGASQVQGPSFL